MPQCVTLKIKICPEVPRLSAPIAVTADTKGQKSLKYNPSGIPLRKPDSDLSSQGSLYKKNKHQNPYTQRDKSLQIAIVM